MREKTKNSRIQRPTHMGQRNNDAEKVFYINKKLKCLARISLTGLLLESKNLSNLQRMVISFHHKAIDLFDGIIQLQKLGLMEDAQILIRVLFETNLNYGCLMTLIGEKGPEHAHEKLWDSIVIMKDKDATQQQAQNSWLQQESMKIQSKYSAAEIEVIKKHGFTLLSVEQRAKNENKIEWYHGMYRNFSRNVHAFDFMEYLIKQGLDLSSEKEYIVDRNHIAMVHAHDCFFQMMEHMNKIFKLGMGKELNKIKREFIQLT